MTAKVMGLGWIVVEPRGEPPVIWSTRYDNEGGVLQYTSIPPLLREFKGALMLDKIQYAS